VTGNSGPTLRLPIRRPRRLTRAIILASATVLVTLVVTMGTGGASQKDVTLVLYSGQHVQTTDSLVAGFEKIHPNVSVVVRSNDEDIFDAEIVAEGSHSPADLFFSENSPALEYLQQRGLLAKVDSSTLEKTPAKYNSPHGDWVGVSARVSVLIYNPSLIKKSALPTSVLALANPKYKGKLAFAAGETDFQPIVTSVLKAYGKKATLKWLDGIKANSASHVYPDNETIANEVNRGVVAFGVINQYYWYRMRAEIGTSNMRSLITYFAPRDPGYVIDVSGAGILKSSTHHVADQEFLAFLVSRQGQEIISHSISYEYPVASGVTTSQPETPFQALKPYPISIAQLGTGAAAIALLNEVQLL
jgi:iron(III) transport system substrate-binding protein